MGLAEYTDMCFSSPSCQFMRQLDSALFPRLLAFALLASGRQTTALKGAKKSALHLMEVILKGKKRMNFCAISNESRLTRRNFFLHSFFQILRDLRHDNLNPLVGACVDQGNVCVITDYCSRGSLKDVFSNEDVKLDHMFVASLVGDVVRGMIFLHESSAGFHGDLKASNCLVDSRWVVKIADFGLRVRTFGWKALATSSLFKDFRFPWRNASDLMYSADGANLEDLLYRAPELLRERDAEKLLANASAAAAKESPTLVYLLQKADAYRFILAQSKLAMTFNSSFSVILYELHLNHAAFASASENCARPFGDFDMSARLESPAVTAPDFASFREALERVIHPRDGDEKRPGLCRPRLESLESCPDFVVRCMRDCWQEDPDDRPDFKTIRSRLRPMRKGLRGGGNIFDNMLAIMERHADNLESLVDERTAMLIDEKKRTEDLLHEMLPRTVADQLMQARRVKRRAPI